MFVKVNNRGLILIKYKVTHRVSVKVNRRGLMKQNTKRVFVNIGTIGSLPLLAKGVMVASSFWAISSRGWLAFRLHGSLSVLGSIGMPKMEINQGIL